MTICDFKKNYPELRVNDENDDDDKDDNRSRT